MGNKRAKLIAVQANCKLIVSKVYHRLFTGMWKVEPGT
jgi:hypothetical protein